jgi:hypothetical protein
VNGSEQAGVADQRKVAAMRGPGSADDPDPVSTLAVFEVLVAVRLTEDRDEAHEIVGMEGAVVIPEPERGADRNTLVHLDPLALDHRYVVCGPRPDLHAPVVQDVNLVALAFFQDVEGPDAVEKHLPPATGGRGGLVSGRVRLGDRRRGPDYREASYRRDHGREL